MGSQSKRGEEKHIHINEVDCPFCPAGRFIYDEAQDFWFCFECFRRSPFIVDEDGMTEFFKGEYPEVIINHYNNTIDKV